MFKDFGAGIKEMWMKSPAAGTVVMGMLFGMIVSVAALFAHSDVLTGALADRISSSSEAVVEAVDELKEAVKDVRAEMQGLNERLDKVERRQSENAPE